MKKKLYVLKKMLNKSADSKTLFSNMGYLVLLKLAGYVFPILTLPYLARVIGVEGFGKIAIAAATVGWFLTITDWGFSYTATRDVARNRDNLLEVSRIFSNVFWAKIILMCISFTILLLLTKYSPYFRDYKEILLITFLIIPGEILFPTWLFQALERMKFITIFNLSSKALFTLLVFVFIKEKTDYILQPLFLSLGTILSGVIASYIIIFKWNIRLNPPDFKEITSTLKSSTDVFINILMPNFYKSFSIVLLGFFGGSNSSGLLDAGSRFVTIAQQFMALVGRVFFPFLSRRPEKHNVYSKIDLYTSIIFAVGLVLFAPLIIKLFYTPEFYPAIPILQLLAGSLVFISMNSVYGTNYLIIKGYEKELRNITFVSSIIGFLSSFPLIYFFDAMGAAITIIIGRGLSAILTTLKAKSIQSSQT